MRKELLSFAFETVQDALHQDAMKLLNIFNMKDKYKHWYEGSSKISVPSNIRYFGDITSRWLFTLNTTTSSGTVNTVGVGENDQIDLNIIAPSNNTNVSLQLGIDYFGFNVYDSDSSVVLNDKEISLNGGSGNGSRTRNVNVNQRIFWTNSGGREIIVSWNITTGLIETKNVFLEDDLTKNFRR